MVQGVVDRPAHVRRTHLAKDRTVDEFQHGMHQGLRVDHHLDPFPFEAEEVVHFDDFKGLVHQGGRAHGDARSHVPVGMLEGHGGGHSRQLAGRAAPEGTTAGGEKHAPHPAEVFAAQALEDGAVFAVHRNDLGTVLSGKLHQELAGHHQGFLVG